MMVERRGEMVEGEGGSEGGWLREGGRSGSVES